MLYDTILKQALKFHQEGDFDNAETRYRQILQANPENCQVLNLLGLVAQSKGMHQEAVDIFSKIILQNPQIAEYYFNFGWSLQEVGKFSEAISAFTKSLLWDKNLKEAHNSIGYCQLALGNETKALEAFKKALALDENYITPQINIAKINGNTQALEALSDKFPLDGEILYHLATMYEDIEQALKVMIKADSLLEDEKIKLFTAELFLQKQDTTSAKYFFEQTLNINPKSIHALINLANMEKNANVAEQMYKKALDIEPENFAAHINYANLLYNTGRKVEALDEYRQATIINPTATELYNNLGIIQRDVGEYEEALGLFMNAFLQNPQQNEYSINIAETLVLLHKNQPETAIKIAESWLRHSPNNPLAKHCLSSLKGEKAENSSEYSKILFDNFASSFENTMQNLGYQLPDIIAQELGDISGIIVDLGCGSGLVGEKIKNNKNQMIGIDISCNILNIARQKNIYNELFCADIMEYLHNKPLAANWFVAADVSGYISNIKKLVDLVYPANFCFSIAVDDSVSDFCLHPNGRFAYNPSFVRAILKDVGYTQIDEKNIIIRHEDKQPVYGVLFIAKKE